MTIEGDSSVPRHFTGAQSIGAGGARPRPLTDPEVATDPVVLCVSLAWWRRSRVLPRRTVRPVSQRPTYRKSLARSRGPHSGQNGTAYSSA